MKLPSDRTVPLLIWLLLLGILSFLSMEKMLVFPQKPLESINLNQARLEDLMTVPRLSARVARAILEARATKGGFKSFGELKSISGVGPKTIENLLKHSFVLD